MIRFIAKAAVAAAAAGVMVAGMAAPALAAGPAQTDRGYENGPRELVGVDLLTNVCLGGGSNVLIQLNADQSDMTDACNDWDQDPSGVDLALNLCALDLDLDLDLSNDISLALFGASDVDAVCD